jgi:hypothetical protein
MDFTALTNICSSGSGGVPYCRYIIKHTTFLNKIPNDDIPAILAVIGAVLNGFVSGWTIENVVYGALMGLASTGFHQAFKSFVEGDSDDSKEDLND